MMYVGYQYDLNAAFSINNWNKKKKKSYNFMPEQQLLSILSQVSFTLY